MTKLTLRRARDDMWMTSPLMRRNYVKKFFKAVVKLTCLVHQHQRGSEGPALGPAPSYDQIPGPCPMMKVKCRIVVCSLTRLFEVACPNPVIVKTAFNLKAQYYIRHIGVAEPYPIEFLGFLPKLGTCHKGPRASYRRTTMSMQLQR